MRVRRRAEGTGCAGPYHGRGSVQIMSSEMRADVKRDVHKGYRANVENMAQRKHVINRGDWRPFVFPLPVDAQTSPPA